jgi:hypothetical protein
MSVHPRNFLAEKTVIDWCSIRPCVTGAAPPSGLRQLRRSEVWLPFDAPPKKRQRKSPDEKTRRAFHIMRLPFDFASLRDATLRMTGESSNGECCERPDEPLASVS